MTHGDRSAHICFVLTLAVLGLGLIPWPSAWGRARSIFDSARSRELNHADRESVAGGYYEGIIGYDGPKGPTETWVRIYGGTNDWARLFAHKVRRNFVSDFLMFELRPNVRETLFNHPFHTNAFGMRDRPCNLEKPPGTFRIAVLGSSIDMGWGIDIEDCYVNQFEDWLNSHASKLGVPRRFEVLNFAVAAYSPMQRLDTFRRKAAGFEPDLVLYSATMLDIRLMEIHLCDLLECRVDPRYDFLKKTIADADLTAYDLQLNVQNELRHKDIIKKKLSPHYWDVYDATLGTLAKDCHTLGTPLACAIIPRVGKSDAPDARAKTVAELRRIIMRHADSLLDVSGTFDVIDSEKVEIAAGDDHPNELGHHRLFRSLADAIVQDQTLYRTLFPMEGRRAP